MDSDHLVVTTLFGVTAYGVMTKHQFGHSASFGYLFLIRTVHVEPVPKIRVHFHYIMHAVAAVTEFPASLGHEA